MKQSTTLERIMFFGLWIISIGGLVLVAINGG